MTKNLEEKKEEKFGIEGPIDLYFKKAYEFELKIKKRRL